MDEVHDDLDGRAAALGQGPIDFPHQIHVQSGDAQTLVRKDGRKYEGPERFRRHASMQSLSSANSLQFVGRHRPYELHGIEDEPHP